MKLFKSNTFVLILFIIMLDLFTCYIENESIFSVLKSSNTEYTIHNETIKTQQINKELETFWNKTVEYNINYKNFIKNFYNKTLKNDKDIKKNFIKDPISWKYLILYLHLKKYLNYKCKSYTVKYTKDFFKITSLLDFKFKFDYKNNKDWIKLLCNLKEDHWNSNKLIILINWNYVYNKEKDKFSPYGFYYW